MRFLGHVVGGVQERFIESFGGGTWGKKALGKPRLRWGIVLKLRFKKWDGEIWIGFVCLSRRAEDRRL